MSRYIYIHKSSVMDINTYSMCIETICVLVGVSCVYTYMSHYKSIHQSSIIDISIYDMYIPTLFVSDGV